MWPTWVALCLSFACYFCVPRSRHFFVVGVAWRVAGGRTLAIYGAWGKAAVARVVGKDDEEETEEEEKAEGAALVQQPGWSPTFQTLTRAAS